MFAYFLRKFPGYTAEDVLNEYASRFYILIQQSFRLDGQDRLEEIQIIGLPNYKHEKDIRRVIRFYENQAAERGDEKPVAITTLRKKGEPRKTIETSL
jgi:hypothetical protein